MNQVETVAFWIGLVGSIVGIVLSIVAITFSVLVDRRSTQVGQHTIQSLQKIESVVEHLSSDTRELIKAGWDRMLGNVEKSTLFATPDSSAKEVAAGIAAELRSELATLNNGKSALDAQARVEQLEKYIRDMELSIKAQLNAARRDSRPSAKLDGILETLKELTQPTYALLRAISRAHLTQDEYKRISAGKFGPSLLELREVGFLVPVVHHTTHGDEHCYYFPPGITEVTRAALQMLPDPSENLQREVATELKAAGYSAKHS